MDELLGVVASWASTAAAPTNIDRATRYEILGLVERLRSWRSTGDPRTLAECLRRFERLERELRPEQREIVQHLMKQVDRGAAGLRPESHMPVRPLPGEIGHMPAQEGAGETVDALIAVLMGVQRGLRRWPTGGESRSLLWRVDSEDAVHRLLWLVLAPAFRQARFEETVGPTGPPRWRPDFVFPELALALEVKFVRGASQWAECFRQIAEDDGYCRSTGSPYDALIVFVWDNSRSNERHDEWTSAVLGLNAVRAVIVASRPGGL